MVWTPIKTWLPHDKLTAAELNAYLRDNLIQSECRSFSGSDALVGVAGRNQLFEMTPTETVSASLFTTSSTTPVATAPSHSVDHPGSFIVFFSCDMSITAGELGQIGPVLSSGEGPASVIRAVRTRSATTTTLAGCVIYTNIETSPVTVQLHGWTNTGVGTLSSTRRMMTTMAL